MNCLKCPILEECPVSKATTESDYSGQIVVPIKAKPYTESECVLLQAIEATKSIKQE